jgi:hypothetical protein
MSKFKVGDDVQIVNAGGWMEGKNRFNGTKATIKSVHESFIFPYVLDPDNGYHWEDNELKLVKPNIHKITCIDCGKLYPTMGLDLVLPDQQWEIICPEGGILCASCICKRARNLGGTVILAWVDQLTSFSEEKITPPAPSFKPVITHRGAFSIQVCVPTNWSDEQVKEFADNESLCGTTRGWQIRRQGDKALVGDNERERCWNRHDFVHIILDA